LQCQKQVNSAGRLAFEESALVQGSKHSLPQGFAVGHWLALYDIPEEKEQSL
jgi:hypothetical protein